MVAILVRTDEAGMLVQLKSNFRFEGQAGALDDHLRREFITHACSSQLPD